MTFKWGVVCIQRKPGVPAPSLGLAQRGQVERSVAQGMNDANAVGCTGGRQDSHGKHATISGGSCWVKPILEGLGAFLPGCYVSFRLPLPAVPQRPPSTPSVQFSPTTFLLSCFLVNKSVLFGHASGCSPAGAHIRSDYGGTQEGAALLGVSWLQETIGEGWMKKSWEVGSASPVPPQRDTRRFPFTAGFFSQQIITPCELVEGSSDGAPLLFLPLSQGRFLGN